MSEGQLIGSGFAIVGTVVLYGMVRTLQLGYVKTGYDKLTKRNVEYWIYVIVCGVVAAVLAALAFSFEGS